jgi:hypothetical protein
MAHQKPGVDAEAGIMISRKITLAALLNIVFNTFGNIKSPILVPMKNKFLFPLIATFIFSINAIAQKTYTANEAADHVQELRGIANPLIDKKSSPEQVEKGVAILKNALAFLDSLPIKQMAPSNAYLWYRRSDANRDLASGFALLGQKDSALNALDRMYANGSSSGVIQFLDDEPTLDAIRDESRYKA